MTITCYCKLLLKFIFLFTISLHSQCEELPMRIAYADYRPYSFFDKGAKGLEIDILNRVLEQEMGIKLHHEILPWKRAQESVKKGHFDAFVSVSTPARGEYSRHSEIPVAYWQISLFARSNKSLNTAAETITIDELKAMRSLSLGALRGNGWIEEHLGGTNIQNASSMHSLVSMLIKGRIDAIPDNSYTLGYYLKQFHRDADIIELPIRDSKIPMYLHISKKSPYLKYLDEFDDVLQHLQKEGELDPFYQKYRH